MLNDRAPEKRLSEGTREPSHRRQLPSGLLTIRTERRAHQQKLSDVVRDIRDTVCRLYIASGVTALCSPQSTSTASHAHVGDLFPNLSAHPRIAIFSALTTTLQSAAKQVRTLLGADTEFSQSTRDRLTQMTQKLRSAITDDLNLCVKQVSKLSALSNSVKAYELCSLSEFDSTITTLMRISQTALRLWDNQESSLPSWDTISTLLSDGISSLELLTSAPIPHEASEIIYLFRSQHAAVPTPSACTEKPTRDIENEILQIIKKSALDPEHHDRAVKIILYALQDSAGDGAPSSNPRKTLNAKAITEKINQALLHSEQKVLLGKIQVTLRQLSDVDVGILTKDKNGYLLSDAKTPINEELRTVLYTAPQTGAPSNEKLHQLCSSLLTSLHSYEEGRDAALLTLREKELRYNQSFVSSDGRLRLRDTFSIKYRRPRGRLSTKRVQGPREHRYDASAEAKRVFDTCIVDVVRETLTPLSNAITPTLGTLEQVDGDSEAVKHLSKLKKLAETTPRSAEEGLKIIQEIKSLVATSRESLTTLTESLAVVPQKQESTQVLDSAADSNFPTTPLAEVDYFPPSALKQINHDLSHLRIRDDLTSLIAHHLGVPTNAVTTELHHEGELVRFRIRLPDQLSQDISDNAESLGHLERVIQRTITPNATLVAESISRPLSPKQDFLVVTCNEAPTTAPFELPIQGTFNQAGHQPRYFDDVHRIAFLATAELNTPPPVVLDDSPITAVLKHLVRDGHIDDFLYKGDDSPQKLVLATDVGRLAGDWAQTLISRAQELGIALPVRITPTRTTVERVLTAELGDSTCWESTEENQDGIVRIRTLEKLSTDRISALSRLLGAVIVVEPLILQHKTTLLAVNAARFVGGNDLIIPQWLPYSNIEQRGNMFFVDCELPELNGLEIAELEKRIEIPSGNRVVVRYNPIHTNSPDLTVTETLENLLRTIEGVIFEEFTVSENASDLQISIHTRNTPHEVSQAWYQAFSSLSTKIGARYGVHVEVENSFSRDDVIASLQSVMPSPWWQVSYDENEKLASVRVTSADPPEALQVASKALRTLGIEGSVIYAPLFGTAVLLSIEPGNDPMLPTTTEAKIAAVAEIAERIHHPGVLQPLTIEGGFAQVLCLQPTLPQEYLSFLRRTTESSPLPIKFAQAPSLERLGEVAIPELLRRSLPEGIFLTAWSLHETPASTEYTETLKVKVYNQRGAKLPDLGENLSKNIGIQVVVDDAPLSPALRAFLVGKSAEVVTFYLQNCGSDGVIRRSPADMSMLQPPRRSFLQRNVDVPVNPSQGWYAGDTDGAHLHEDLLHIASPHEIAVAFAYPPLHFDLSSPIVKDALERGRKLYLGPNTSIHMIHPEIARECSFRSQAPQRALIVRLNTAKDGPGAACISQEVVTCSGTYPYSKGDMLISARSPSNQNLRDHIQLLAKSTVRFIDPVSDSRKFLTERCVQHWNSRVNRVLEEFVVSKGLILIGELPSLGNMPGKLCIVSEGNHPPKASVSFNGPLRNAARLLNTFVLETALKDNVSQEQVAQIQEIVRNYIHDSNRKLETTTKQYRELENVAKIYQRTAFLTDKQYVGRVIHEQGNNVTVSIHSSEQTHFLTSAACTTSLVPKKGDLVTVKLEAYNTLSDTFWGILTYGEREEKTL
jgi:hypothetical protein